LRKVRPEVKEMVISISFTDDRVFTPLQAADVLANLTNRYWRGNLRQTDPVPEPPETLKLLLTAKDGGSFI
jgi:hypothetical protein